MDQYSQHHLKRAATEPEHVMRKAEFDLAVESLDERIETIEKTLDVRPGFSGGVMSSRSGIETLGLNDDLSIPAAISVSESSVLSDEVGQIRTAPVSGNLPPEQVGMSDGISAPQAEPASDYFPERLGSTKHSRKRSKASGGIGIVLRVGNSRY